MKYSVPDLESLDYQGLLLRLETLINERELLSDLEYQAAKDRVLTLINSHVESYLRKAQDLEEKAIAAIESANSRLVQQVENGVGNTVRAISTPTGLNTLERVPGMVSNIYQPGRGRESNSLFSLLSISGLVVFGLLTQLGAIQKTFFPTLQDTQESGMLVKEGSPDWKPPNPYSLRYDP